MLFTTFNIDYLLNEFDKSIYTIPLRMLLNILFLFVAIKYRSSVEKANRIFLFYGVLFLAENFANIKTFTR